MASAQSGALFILQGVIGSHHFHWENCCKSRFGDDYYDEILLQHIRDPVIGGSAGIVNRFTKRRVYNSPMTKMNVSPVLLRVLFDVCQMPRGLPK
jgi:hypothetical protein